jgi:hypothetical protein
VARFEIVFWGYSLLESKKIYINARWRSFSGWVGLALSLAAAIFIALQATATRERIELGIGQNLVEQYCRGCHSFNNEKNTQYHLGTKKFADDYLRYRIINNPSGIYPQKSSDQQYIIRWLRHNEKDAPPKKEAAAKSATP